MLTRREFLQAMGMTLTLSSPLIFAESANADISNLKFNSFLRAIPKTDELIPSIGLGTSRTFHVDVDDKVEMQKRVQVLKNFFAAGGGMIDSSPMYANAEQVLGLCFDQMDMEQLKDNLFSTSKVWSMNTQAGIREYAQSEKNWRETQFDLMQVHNLLNWQEHLKTLQKYKAEGRLRYIGITTSHKRRHSEFSDIMRDYEIDFVQVSYSLANRLVEKNILPLAQEKKLGVIINRGFQTGHMFDLVAGQPLPDWASEIQVNTWAHFFLKFIISHPAVTVVIPATSNPEHMLENMQAMHGDMPDQKMREEMIRYYETVIKT